MFSSQTPSVKSLMSIGYVSSHNHGMLNKDPSVESPQIGLAYRGWIRARSVAFPSPYGLSWFSGWVCSGSGKSLAPMSGMYADSPSTFPSKTPEQLSVEDSSRIVVGKFLPPSA